MATEAFELHEREALQKIQTAGVAPVDIVIGSTDADKDPDDRAAAAVAAGLRKRGLIRLLGAAVSLSSDGRRARLVKAMLEDLGFTDVPVARGSNDDPGYEPKPYEFAAARLAPPARVEPDGPLLLKRTFEEARRRNRKITLLLIGSMTDAHNVIRDNPELAKAAIDKVTIMGGVEIEKDESGECRPRLDADGYMAPDSSANNCWDRRLNPDPEADPVGPAAKGLLRLLQRYNIRMQIVTRLAAYDAAVPIAFYDKLAEAGHPVAARLRSIQGAALLGLLEDILARRREARLTEQWFYKTFTDNSKATVTAIRTGMEAIRRDPERLLRYITTVKLHDAVTMLVAGVSANAGIFDPYKVRVHNTEHEIIGISENRTGIRNAAEMRTLLFALGKLGVSSHGDDDAELARSR